MKKNPENIKRGQELRLIRERLRLSRAELGQQIDRSERTIRHAENGAQALSDKAWERVYALRDNQTDQPEMNLCEQSEEPYITRRTANAAPPCNGKISPDEIVAVMADEKTRTAAEELSRRLDITMTSAVIGVAVALRTSSQEN